MPGITAFMEAIIAARAFFISRLRARVYVLDTKGERLALRETLRRLSPKPVDIARAPVLMTENRRVPCEMIALRVPRRMADGKLEVKHKEQGFKPSNQR